MDSQPVVEAFLGIARSRPKKIFAKLLFPGRPDLDVTYGELLAQASRYANFYGASGVKRGQVVILILRHGPELLYSLVGAMLHGSIPSIFSFPSPKTSAAEYRRTLSLLLKVCDTRFLVAPEEFAADFAGSAVVPEGMELLSARGYRRFPPSFGPAPPTAPGDIVLLQHSSGTTGLKKGVALSNRSVMNQLEAYASALELRPDDRIVSWLPLYHDMGLIACFILPLLRGVPVVLMSPFDWVADPAMLLRAISRERGTLCWQPNFAYNFLASRVAEGDLESVDLSSMRAFINCAEPISADSHEMFYARFKGRGLRSGALATCYAMAENVFAVTQGGIRRPAKVERTEVRRVVSSGELLPRVELKIIDERGRTLPERRVGEIVIHSDSLLTEYYHRPDLTAAALKDGWYFTGDLGYLAEGELFVTGRKKDMIIVAGKNIYPQDIEEVVSSVAGVHPGRTVAFGLYNKAIGTEDVVILAETPVQEEAKRTELKLAIAAAVRQALECVAGDIVLVPHMWLLKSTAGKIARAANCDKYLKTRGEQDHG